MKLHTYYICTLYIIRFDCGFKAILNLCNIVTRMDTASLTGFMSHNVPTYVDLFKVKHSDNEAVILFQSYLCYRALQDVLSLRTSRWEYLVQS